MKCGLIFLTIILSIGISHAQILKVDSIISPNQITTYKNQNLILLDFWATWCGPCVPATRQLEIMQENRPNDVFIISISDEKNNKIKNFLQEKPIKLLVASDDKSSLIKKYNVITRPYSIMLNKQGNILWQGKPGDLSSKLLDNLIRSEAKKIYGDKVISDIIEEKDSLSRLAGLTIDNIVDVSTIQVDYRNIYPNRKYNFFGTLLSFISEYKQIPKLLIDDNTYSQRKIGVVFPSHYAKSYSKSQLADSVLSLLNINLFSKEIEYKVYELSIENKSMLWDTTQINWEKGSPDFLIGDVSIEANDVTLKELATQLSNIKEEIYLYKGNDENLYDFNFVYSDNKIMKEDLLNTFGISIEQKMTKVLRYNFEILEFKKSSIDIE